MKKFIIATTLLLAANGMAMEGSIRAGFDFYRSIYELDLERPGRKINTKYEKGWTIGAEIFPYTNKYVSLGAGVEYNFGLKSLKMEEFRKGEQAPIFVTYQEKGFYQIPVYAVAKVNAYDFGDKKGAIYVPLRLGYTISNDIHYKGVYYGAGIGYENGPFLIEAVYNGTYGGKICEKINYHPKDYTGGESGDYTGGESGEGIECRKTTTHRAGVRLGYKFGEKKTKKETTNGKTINIIVSPVVAPEISPTINPVISSDLSDVNKTNNDGNKNVVKTKGKLINALCDFDAKKCTIHGFKVDHRDPNREELANIKEIADLLNENVKSARVLIVGHTDSTASVEYNQKLSEERAKSVTNLLRQAGLKNSISVERIYGRSELEPMATNNTKDGRYLNRRVEILFTDIER